jgi:predicted small lipoprotein YifL
MNKRFLLLALLACLLAACGNKGPLVMPQKPVPVEEQEVKPAPQPPADGPAQDAKADGHDHE